MAPGQKSSLGSDDLTSASVYESREEAAAEALNMSFGSNSYAQRILKGMGWKEVYPVLLCWKFPIKFCL